MGSEQAELLYPDSNESDGWCHQETGDLRDLCERELDGRALPTHRPSSSGDGASALTHTDRPRFV
jgi:hypothetical protein